MDAGTELKTLEAEIQELQDLIRAEAQAARRRERVVPAISLVLVSIVAGFLAVNYFWFRRELSPERLGASLERELQELGPSAARELGRLGQDLLPVYAAELQKQLERSWPDICRRVQDEVDHLGANALARTHQTLLECQARVLEKTQKALFESYPHLESPREREQIAAHLRAVCDATVAQAIGRFDSLFSKDVQSLEDALFKFDVSDTHEPTVELQKKFLRLWLQVLEQEIMEI